MTADFGHPPDTIKLGDLEVRRLGFGAMRIPGPEVWGEPEDPARARAVLRRTIELGINFIDTSWYYGPYVANRFIAETLHPYPKDLVIACKLGGMRRPDKSWGPALRPEELRKGCEDDLRTLKLDRIDVVHLRAIGAPGVPPLMESLDALIALQREGKIRHIGLSNVSLPQVQQSLERTPIVSVQNLYSVSGGSGQLAKMTHAEVENPEGVLDFCTAHGIAFLPFFPLAVGAHGQEKPEIAELARRHDATPAQLALAWLLARSPVMLPIPGTSRVEHLEQNWAARRIRLSPEERELLAVSAKSA